MKPTIIILLLIAAGQCPAQTANTLVYEGNQFYAKSEFDKAAGRYQQALTKKPGNETARFNLGNVQFRQGNYEEAAKTFESTASDDKTVQAGTLYNKGVALAKQNKLTEAVDAFKASLKINAADEDCRYNLAFALSKLKKEQQEKEKQQKNKKDPKPDNQKKEQEQEKPKPQQSKLNKQQVQQVLQMIRRKEKNVQQKVNQQETPGIVQPAKDW